MYRPSQQIPLNDPIIFQNERPSNGSVFDFYLDNEDWWLTKLEGPKVDHLSIPKLQIDFHLSGNDLQKLVGMKLKLSHFTLHSFLWRHVLIKYPNIFIFSLNLLILFKRQDLKLNISFHITCQDIKLEMDRWDEAIFKLHV